MRSPTFVLLALTLAACSPAVPDSGAGVGFGDYNQYPAEPIPSPMQSTLPVAPATGFSPESAAAAIDRASGLAPTPAPYGQTIPTQPTYTAQPTYIAQPTYPAQPATLPSATQIATGDTGLNGSTPAGIKEENGELVHSGTGISDEQDFEAVKSRETIQSDKARIERNKSQYQVDQPGALPERPAGDNTALIVQFALATNHPVGTQMYDRSSLRLGSADAACAKFSTPDAAQDAFLNAGGPDRDRKGLDPDGDGYACGWNPAPFRAALQ